MIYCEKRKGKYIDQNKYCYHKCIFYNAKEDSCWYPEWYPGLKKGRKWNQNE